MKRTRYDPEPTKDMRVSTTSEHRPDIGCLKVSSKSSPASVAGAIAGMVKDGVCVEIQAVGAGAVNQAVKAIAIARGYLAPSGIDVACVPSFVELEINGDTRTGIRFAVHPHYSDDFAEVEETVDEAALV